jgi:thiamine biosynthesis lipoprotein
MRSVIWFSSLGRGVLAALLARALTCAAPAQESPTAPQRHEFTEPEMGVPFRIVLYAANAQEAQAAAQAAFNRIAQLNQILSDYETDSELNELSRTAGQGQAVPVSDDLWRVLAQAQHFAEQSHGAFDITVGPAVVLWRRARRLQRLPEPERLAEALKAVGYTKIRLNPADRTVELLAPRMKLDLGGIAKGYALDEALKVLQARGISRALVTGGGDMVMSDPPPGQVGWRIEIAPLDVPQAPPKRYIRLARAGLATSGDVFQRLEIDGRRYSHIVDPRTGVGLTDHSLVTVIAPDGMTADALATTVSVLGPEEGLKFAEQTPGAEVYLVRRVQERIDALESSGFRKFDDRSAAPD